MLMSFSWTPMLGKNGGNYDAIGCLSTAPSA